MKRTLTDFAMLFAAGMLVVLPFVALAAWVVFTA